MHVLRGALTCGRLGANGTTVASDCIMFPRPEDSAVSRVRSLTPHLTPQEAAELVELVQRHSVEWEVWPERQVFGGEIRQIGIEIDLLGRHNHPRHTPYPGCDECSIVRAALKRIANAVLPRGERASRYEIQRFDGSLSYPDARGEGRVELVIKIVHREGYDEPPDACQFECVREIESRLLALVAKPRHRSLGAVSAS